MIFLVSCEESKVIPTLSKDSVNFDIMPDQIGWENTVFFVDSSFTKAKLVAKRARVYHKRNETLLDSGFRVDFFSKWNNKRMSYLTADSASIDELTKNMHAYGHVVAINDSSKTRMETSQLFWNNKTEKFYSTEFVKVISPKERIQGYGFESDQNLTNYKIFKVSGEQK